MLIVGDFSGIQEFLFDVTQEGGGQARRLRARSFFIQLLAECAALKVLNALKWKQSNLIFCGAAKFILEGIAIKDESESAIQQVRTEIELWLLEELGAELRFAMACSSEDIPLHKQYGQVMQKLQTEKLHAWKSITITGEKWETHRLILPVLDPLCPLCRHRVAEASEMLLDTGLPRTVCRWCHLELKIGEMLPRVEWVAVWYSFPPGTEVKDSRCFEVLGMRLGLFSEPDPSADFLFTLTDKVPPTNAIAQKCSCRRLARHIPTESQRVIEFVELASRASGADLLGVLKADVDSLGVHINQLLEKADTLASLAEFSRALDDFFAAQLESEMQKPEWNLMYTIFSGGDDLLMVGPWDLAMDFASHIHILFEEQFGRQGLTFSASLTFIKPKRPIKFAADQAEELLHLAKTQAATGSLHPKDQMATLGQIWKWNHHAFILEQSKQLKSWVQNGKAQRGWIQTLLHLAMDRLVGDHQTGPRLVYHVVRNYPRLNDNDNEKVALRRWVNQIIEDFEKEDSQLIRYLPSILRYALTATRSANE